METLVTDDSDADWTGGLAHARRIENLHRAIRSKLIRIARFRLGSKDEAEEIAQRTYEALLAHDRPETIRDWERYAVATATNLTTNRLKQRATYRATHQTTDEELPVEVEDRRSPELIYGARQDIEEVMQVVNELPARTLTAFTLYYFDGKSYDEIGEVLKVHSGTARRHVARALEYLDEKLGYDDGKGRKQ